MAKPTRRSWIHSVMLNPYFEQALVNMRQDTGLGVSYALLVALNEFFKSRGYMSKEGYEFNKSRYNLSLIDEFRRQNKQSTQPYEELLEAGKLNGVVQDFQNALSQWDTMKPTSQEYYTTKAQDFPKLPIAQEILKLSNNHTERGGDN